VAVKYNETDQWYELADSAAMSCPAASPWCFGIWTRVDDNSGSLFQYLFSSGNFAVADSLHLYLSEAGEGNANKWSARVEAAALQGTSAYGADGKNRLLILQNDGTTCYLQACVSGGSVVTEASVAFTSAINNGAFNIGRRADANADRYYGGVAGEFFKGDFFLSNAEIEALASGMTIWQLGYTPDCYHPMVSAEATIYDVAGAHNGTRNGSPTTVEDFPISRVLPEPIFIAASASGGVTKTITDIGSASDSINSIAVGFSLNDIGTGDDSAPGPSNDFSLADTGSGADQISGINVTFSITDSGLGTDAVSVLSAVLKALSDQATGSDVINNIGVSATVSDNGAGVDAQLITVSLSVIDTATGDDVLNVIKTSLKVISDIGSGNDALSVEINVPVSDIGIGLDASSITTLISIIETAIGVDVVSSFDAQTQIVTMYLTLKARRLTLSMVNGK